jgi:hypothetical protein
MIKNNEELKTIFQHLANHGCENGYNTSFQPTPTNAPPGSKLKIEILMKRLELGQDLWNDMDRNDFVGLTSPVKPSKFR